MAAIHRLVGQGAKRLCLRPARTAAATTSVRAFSATCLRRYATPYDDQQTRLIPTDESFSNTSDPYGLAQLEGDKESVHKAREDSVAGRKIRHYTVYFGPQHPAAHR